MPRAERYAWAALTAAVALPLVPALVLPSSLAEDAAMLARYAGHVAAGHGMVWNIGDAPVDGGTDFVPLLLAAGAVRWGVDLVSALRGLGLAAHLLLLWGVWRSGARAGVPSHLRVWLLLPVAWGPAASYIGAGFLAPVFALAAGAVRAIGARAWDAPAPFGHRLAYVVAAVSLGMIRPEGVILAAAITVGLAIERPERLKPLFTQTAIGFATLGVGYLAFRWWYFGHLLPPPFWVKGAFRLHGDGVLSALIAAVLLVGPLAWPAWRAVRGARQIAGLWVAPAIFLLAFVLLSSETNFWYRFQYPVVALIAWPLMWSWPRWSPGARASVARWEFAAVSAVGSTLMLLWFFPWPALDTRDAIGRALADLPGQRTMAVSEAGLLPLRSGWRAIDAYGLNDYAIARDGLRADRLEAERPDLIVMAGSLATVTDPPADAPDAERWDRMVATLARYARDHDYQLAAFWGQTPSRGHAYFVRADAPDRDRLVAAVRPPEYQWIRPRTRRFWRHPRQVLADWFTGAHHRDRAVNLALAR